MNAAADEMLIHSLALRLGGFVNDASIEYQQLINRLPPPFRGRSSLIIVSGGKVLLSPSKDVCHVLWGKFDDSAGTRGKPVSAISRRRVHAMEEILKLEFRPVVSVGAVEEEYELLPPTFRFVLKSKQSDSFHFQLSGEERGVYHVQFVIGYHIAGSTQSVVLPETYSFIQL